MPFVSSVFGVLERVLSEDLYPYRYPITVIAVLVLVALITLAISKGGHRVVGRHRIAFVLLGAPLLVAAVLAGNYLLSPLVDRSRLDEASPLDAVVRSGQPVMDVGSGVEPTGMSSELKSKGSFQGADDFHFGRGTALIITGADGKNTLRFEDFSVRNGPDLYVYLSQETSGKRVDQGLSLGRLKATDGAFNYEIPDSIDAATIKSVVVWCRQFSVLFAMARLER